MSMCRCEGCDQIFDSDDDPDCFVEVGNMRRLHKTMIFCEPCRELREEWADRDFSPEQLAIIDRISAEHDEEPDERAS